MPRREPEGLRARRAAAALRAVATGLALLASAPAAAVEVEGGTTSLWLAPVILSDLGISLEEVHATAAPLRDGALGFRVRAASRAELDARGSDFEGFVTADLRHVGGFALRIGGELVRFPELRVAAAPAPDELAIVTRQGVPWLVTRAMHARLEPGRLELAHADVMLAPTLAARLGRPDLAGSALGVLDARYVLADEPASPLMRQGEACVADIGPPVDLELFDLTQMSQAVREAGGRVAMAPQAYVRNLGPGDVDWRRAIAPDAPLGPHPFLVLSFYRLSADGVLQQLGRSDAKHAFFSVNNNCPCPGDNVMYAGCEDLYGVSTNLNRTHFAPRDEIDPVARSWTSLGSHFDGTPVDDVRSHAEAGHDPFEHRLFVQEPDLQEAGARYFYEGWYLAPGDTDLGNSLGHRETTPTFAGSTWSFPTVGAMANGPILDRVVDPLAPPAGTDNRLVDTGQGRLQLVAQTQERGGGVTRYVWTLQNFDQGRAIARFSIPLLPGQTAANPTFRDADADPGNDWTVTLEPLAIHWDAPPGAALTWGGLYGFGAEIDAAPVVTRARLEPAGPGLPAAYAIDTLGPAAPLPAVPSLGRGAALAAIAGLLLLGLWRVARARRAASPA